MNERRNLWWVWVIVGVVVLAAIAAAVWFFWLGGGRASTSPSPTATPSATPTATPRPTTTATPTRTAVPTATATPTAAPTPTATATAAPVTDVTPFITSAGWSAADGGIDVSSFVPQIVESGGTCTITATSGGASAQASFDAVASATTTECGSQVLTSPQLTSGSWSVVVSYSSPTSSGASAATEVVIP